MFRQVKKTVAGDVTHDGAGVKLVRVLGRPTVYDFDPFLMLDAFDSTDPQDYVKGFPWHPHRGIETVTYLIAGHVEHGDSLGNKGVIGNGDCQWMTAGRGIIHQEMPKPSEQMLGVQLWLNLPKRDKMTAPQYNDITADSIPVIKEQGYEVRVLSGEYKGTSGAMQAQYVDMLFLDVNLEPNANWSMGIDSEHTLFVYIVNGAGKFHPEAGVEYQSKQAVLLEGGDEIIIQAIDEGMRILLFAAKPLKEPIAWGGPIVMNTDEELMQAFADIKEGTFIDHEDGSLETKKSVHDEYYRK